MAIETDPPVSVDIDDVLAQHVAGWLTFTNTRFGTTFTLEQYHEDWGTLWQVDAIETEARKQQFFDPEIIGAFEMIAEADVALARMARVRRLIGVTARRQNLAPVTSAWVKQKNCDQFEKIRFATYFDERGIKHTLSKGQICQEEGVSHHVDDQLKHCLSVLEVGITPVLVDSYGWHRSTAVPQGIIYAANLGEVADYFEDAAER